MNKKTQSYMTTSQKHSKKIEDILKTIYGQLSLVITARMEDLNVHEKHFVEIQNHIMDEIDLYCNNRKNTKNETSKTNNSSDMANSLQSTNETSGKD